MFLGSSLLRHDDRMSHDTGIRVCSGAQEAQRCSEAGRLFRGSRCARCPASCPVTQERCRQEKVPARQGAGFYFRFDGQETR